MAKSAPRACGRVAAGRLPADFALKAAVARDTPAFRSSLGGCVADATGAAEEAGAVLEVVDAAAGTDAAAAGSDCTGLAITIAIGDAVESKPGAGICELGSGFVRATFGPFELRVPVEGLVTKLGVFATPR